MSPLSSEWKPTYEVRARDCGYFSGGRAEHERSNVGNDGSELEFVSGSI